VPKFVIVQELLTYPIEILDVPHRVMIRLKQKEIRTLEQLSQMSEEDLLSIYHFGRKSLDDIRRRLELINECARKKGGPPSELLECMRLRLSGTHGMIEQIVNSIADGEVDEQSISYFLSVIPTRSAFVLVERLGLRRQGRRTLQELADMMNLTRERVRQLQNRSMEALLDAVSEAQILQKWDKLLMEAATDQPTGEQGFLENIAKSGCMGKSTAAGFAIIATHLIKGTDIPVLLKASRDGRLYRFWVRRKK
jgi:hypothetical protein